MATARKGTSARRSRSRSPRRRKLAKVPLPTVRPARRLLPLLHSGATLRMAVCSRRSLSAPTATTAAGPRRQRHRRREERRGGPPGRGGSCLVRRTTKSKPPPPNRRLPVLRHRGHSMHTCARRQLLGCRTSPRAWPCAAICTSASSARILWPRASASATSTWRRRGVVWGAQRYPLLAAVTWDRAWAVSQAGLKPGSSRRH